jgi:hypothetical protein
MKKMILPTLAFYLFSACSSSQSDNNTSETDGGSSSGVSSSAEPVGIGPLSVLDTDNIKIYETGDTVVQLPETPVADSASEISALTKDTRVTRVGEGLTFQLKSGETKVLKENKTTDGDGYEAYTYLQSLDEIGQWLVLCSYYESMDYLLIDQQLGTETHLWGYPVISPDKNHILTSMVDLEAGFVPNGFQLWTIEEDNIILAYEQELAEWGFDKSIWTNGNEILAQQTYRDKASGDLKTRVIKMHFTEGAE